MTPGGIPGADELLGKGVYHGMPEQIPHPVRDKHAIVVGDASTCGSAARRLTGAGWRVTMVTREHHCRGLPRGCQRKTRTEVACAVGIEHLEVLALRRSRTGRIEACHASALFVL